MEHHKHLGCRPSITIDKHPCDALPILLCSFLCISSFCWCKGTSFSSFTQIIGQINWFLQAEKVVFHGFMLLGIFKDHSYVNTFVTILLLNEHESIRGLNITFC